MRIVFATGEVVFLFGGVYCATVGNWIGLAIAVLGMLCLLLGSDWKDT